MSALTNKNSLIGGFYILFTYRPLLGKAGQGAFAIHPDLKPLFCELLPENLPYNSCPPPGDIVDYLRMTEERERSVNLMAVREKQSAYSPGYTAYTGTRGEQTAAFRLSTDELLQEAMVASSSCHPTHHSSFHHSSSSFNYSTGISSVHHLPSSYLEPSTAFSFDRSLDEFGLTAGFPR